MIEQAIKAIESDYSHSPNGRHAHFVRLDDKWGVKVYKEKEIRNLSYNNQKHASFFGLGPKVGDWFDVGEAEMYCYITEVADCLCDDGEPPQADIFFDGEKYAEAVEDVEEFLYPVEELNELCSKLRGIGLKFYDCHLGNVGYLRGKLVCIDFGE